MSAQQLPTVALIGAGSSGIAVAKALHERGIAVRLLRDVRPRRRQLGLRQRATAMSAAYRSLHINTSRERMEYSDFPMPESYPDFPHHDQIADVLRRLRRPLRLPRPHPLRDRRRARRPGATTASTTLRTDTGETHALRRACSSPTATTGTRAGPSPRSPGSDDFEGEQIHAHQYEDESQLDGKDVVVLGMGNSAMDIAVDAELPRQEHLPRRAPRRVDHPQVPRSASRSTAGDQIFASPRIPFKLRQAGLMMIVKLQVGQHGGLRPAQARPQARRGAPDDLRPHPRPPQPRARSRPSRTSRGCTSDEVEFADGTRVARRPRRLLHGLQDHVPVLRRGLHLGARQPHRAVPARLPPRASTTSRSSGLLQPLGAIMPLAEAQGQWLADYLKGEYRLPSPTASCAPTSPRTRRRCASATSPPSATRSRSTSTTTCYELGKERRKGAERARPAGFALPVPARARSQEARRRVTRRAAGRPARATKSANRAAILDAGREVFAEIGYGAATGPRHRPPHRPGRRGTFYNYFPDKESVFRALLEESAAEARARVRAARRGRPDDARGLRRRRLPRVLRASSPRTRRCSSSSAATPGRSARMFAEPAFGRGVERARGGPRRGGRRRPGPDDDVDTWRRRWSAPAFEVGVRMIERDPPDVDGATSFAAGLFLGGIARLSQT